jgi:hypothetical protein
MRYIRTATGAGLIVLSICCIAAAQPLRGNIRGGTVTLPYNTTDNSGNQWVVYQQGWFRQQGQQPLFSQGAQLIVNGNGWNSPANTARLDEKTGELVMENVNIGGVSVTRRILVDRQGAYIRYIDVFKNPQPQEVSINIQYNTSFNYGMQSSQPIPDPRNRDRTIGCAVMLQTGRTIYELYAGRGAKNLPQINAPQGNNVVQTSQQLTVPAGKQVALFHLHGLTSTPDAAVQFANNLKESQILATVSPDVRKLLVNLSNYQAIGDRELLRGDLFDVVELRGGDQIKGTITPKAYKLTTFYGTIELPAERVVGMFSVGQVRPRQLLVTVDGEVFGGTLDVQTIGMQLSSGQTTQIPLTQISRFGYRKRSGEAEEWTFDRPMVSLRSGERMLVSLPTTPIDVVTQYGALKLKPESIAAIDFQPEDRAIPEVLLSDGSRFTGLATADHFELQLVGTASQQTVTFPLSIISRLQFGKNPEDAQSGPDAPPTLRLTNEDEFAGTIAGQLKLETTFDTITINGSELASLAHTPDAGFDVQATLWDQTTLSGQLKDPQVTCNLKSGVSVTVPVPMIARYENSHPRPSDTMVDRIKAVVADLSAEDWKKREAAEAQLVTMGTSVIPVLKEMRDSQPIEAQQRIDSVLKQLDKKPPTGGSNSPINADF